MFFTVQVKIENLFFLTEICILRELFSGSLLPFPALRTLVPSTAMSSFCAAVRGSSFSYGVAVR